jgi:hypothetical protein
MFPSWACSSECRVLLRVAREPVAQRAKLQPDGNPTDRLINSALRAMGIEESGPTSIGFGILPQFH